MIDLLHGYLDWLATAVVAPLFALGGRGLETVLLRPLAALHLPWALQVAVAGAVTGSISLFLRRRLRLAAREEAFRSRFASLRRVQEPIGGLADWRAREVLYRTSDSLLDEEYNAYLARRFALQVAVYMLPVLLMLAWVDAYAPVPETSVWRSPSPPFLAAYLTVVAAGLLAGRRRASRSPQPVPAEAGHGPHPGPR